MEPARQATLAGGIHSLESIPGLHKLLKIRALGCFNARQQECNATWRQCCGNERQHECKAARIRGIMNASSKNWMQGCLAVMLHEYKAALVLGCIAMHTCTAVITATPHKWIRAYYLNLDTYSYIFLYTVVKTIKLCQILYKNSQNIWERETHSMSRVNWRGSRKSMYCYNWFIGHI